MSWWEIGYNVVILLMLLKVREHQDFQNSKLSELDSGLDYLRRKLEK